MIETQSVADLIESQIKIAVDQQVQHALADNAWIDRIEQQIVGYVQDRIVARFSNLSNMPDLIETVKISVGDLITQGHIPGIEKFVDQGSLRVAMNHAIENLVESTIDTLILDPDWLTKMEHQLKSTLAQLVMNQLHTLDIDQTIRDQIDQGIERWQNRLIENFSTHGIRDLATDNRLTVMDDGVVFSTGIAAPELLIERDARINGTLIVDKLAVGRGMNTDAPGWQPLIDNIADRTFNKVNDAWRSTLVQEVLDLAQTQGINFDQVLIQGAPLVDDGVLNPAVKITSIERTGTLQELHVSGLVKLNDSVTVTNRRLGVNTETPEMALSVWDEEVSVVVGKMSKDRAYIGSGRNQGLSIGVNRSPQIEINTEGLTTIRQLCVGRHRIGHTDQVPGWSGTRGDIVFNSNPRSGDPFAWQCLGGFQWQPLRGS